MATAHYFPRNYRSLPIAGQRGVPQTSQDFGLGFMGCFAAAAAGSALTDYFGITDFTGCFAFA
jgi:hypothetical protein